ncbi:MAG: outer membrane protein assembly factor BamD [Planctomycetes bacterium]|nr:outer membrane protein assembly factor BamD [Planctomycetota bacterium]
MLNIPFISRPTKTEDLAGIDDVRGPLERIVQAGGVGRGGSTASLPPAEGQAELDEARKLYDAGDYDTAEKAFEKVGKRYKGTQLEEDALFMIGECRFFRRDYAKAEDGYQVLLKEFPSTRHMDRVTRRFFTIAQAWLEFPQVVSGSEIQQVDFTDPKATPPPEPPGPSSKDLTRVVPVLPNFFDKSRPVFDTDGRALEALRQIWLNDPTGPLADDAIMLTASHYLRDGNYMEAARMYDMLRENYPKSDHLKEAFVLGAHSTAMAHQGPLYDGTALTRSRELRESAIRLFPHAVDRERLLDEIRRIDDEKARSEWANVEYWQKRRDPVAVATSCREVIRLYPNSSYAAEARELLAEIEGRESPSQSAPEAAPTDPYDPYANPPRPLTPPMSGEPTPPGRSRL